MKKLLLALAFFNSTLLAAPRPCTRILSAHAQAYVKLLAKAHEDGEVTLSQLREITKAAEFVNPVGNNTTTANNVALKDAFEKTMPHLVPADHELIKKSLTDYLIKLNDQKIEVDGASSRTQVIVSPQVMYRTEWIEPRDTDSSFYWHRTADAQDWLIALNDKSLNLRAFNPNRGREPVVDEVLPENFVIYGSNRTRSTTIRDVHSSANGSFYVAYYAKTSIRLFEVNKNGAKVFAGEFPHTTLNQGIKRIIINETKHGLLVTAVGGGFLETFKVEGSKLVSIWREEDFRIFPDTVFPFENEKGEWSIFAHVFSHAGGVRFHLFLPLAGGSSEIAEKIPGVTAHVFPFVTRSGRLHVAVETETEDRGLGLYFLTGGNKDHTAFSDFRYPRNRTVARWHESSDGRVHFAVVGYSYPAQGKWTPALTMYSILEGKAPTEHKIDLGCEPHIFSWHEGADGKNRFLVIASDGLRILDADTLLENEAKLKNPVGAFFSPGIYSNSQGNLIYGSMTDGNLHLNDLLSRAPLPTIPGELQSPGYPAATPWHTMANGEVVTAIFVKDFVNHGLRVVRLTKASVGSGP